MSAGHRGWSVVVQFGYGITSVWILRWNSAFRHLVNGRWFEVLAIWLCGYRPGFCGSCSLTTPWMSTLVCLRYACLEPLLGRMGGACVEFPGSTRTRWLRLIGYWISVTGRYCLLRMGYQDSEYWLQVTDYHVCCVLVVTGHSILVADFLVWRHGPCMMDSGI